MALRVFVHPPFRSSRHTSIRLCCQCCRQSHPVLSDSLLVYSSGLSLSSTSRVCSNNPSTSSLEKMSMHQLCQRHSYSPPHISLSASTGRRDYWDTRIVFAADYLGDFGTCAQGGIKAIHRDLRNRTRLHRNPGEL